MSSPLRNAPHWERVILDELHERAMCNKQIQAATTLSRPTVRKFMRSLTAQGLVEFKRYGNAIVFQLTRTRKAA